MSAELERLRQVQRELEEHRARVLAGWDATLRANEEAIAAEEARLAASKYPAEGSEGYFLSGDLCVQFERWHGDDFQRAAFDNGNWHATEADAIAARDRWAAVNKLGKVRLPALPGVSVVGVYFPRAAWDAMTPDQRRAMGGEG